MINATLAAELAGTVHALAIKAQAPGEKKARLKTPREPALAFSPRFRSRA